MSISNMYWHQLVEAKHPVFIWKNTLCKDELWSVCTRPNVEGFWLDAYPTLKEAKEFCRKYQLPIIGIFKK